MDCISPKYQVAVIVYTYNSDLKETLDSIRSAVLQCGVHHQIIVADDGSKDNHKEEIEQLFHELDFEDYVFSILECNKGITENLRQASTLVEAEYIKILSPADYLADSDVLAKLYSFASTGGYRVCFGDAIFYSQSENGDIVPLANHKNAPALLKPYDTGNINAQLEACLIINDFILGAAVFTETATYRKYINKISGYVKYFEDNALRLMIYDGIAVHHFPEVIMWYEFGSGISTNGSKHWEDVNLKDYYEANKLIMKSADFERAGGIIRYMIRLIYSRNKCFSRLRYFVLPGVMLKIIAWKYFPVKSLCNPLNNFLNNILSSEHGDSNAID